MSIDFSFSKQLSEYQATCIDVLVFEKNFYLKNKKNGFITPAYKANQLFQAIIKSYIFEYSKALKDDCSIKKYDLSIGMSIKGSTAAAIFNQMPLFEQNDLDTVIDFDKLPHESSYIANNIFYRKVACQAILNLLRIHFKDKLEIFNPEDFFENLILFSDNSVFLVSFANIDFAFPVPDQSKSKIKKSSSTFLHESLKIKVPITNGKIKRKSNFEFDSDFEFDLETIRRVFLEKTIIIPSPEIIFYNGLERLGYSVSKGWTILDKDSTYVLIEDFSKRVKGSFYNSGGLFSKLNAFDRLMSLIVKKEVYPMFSLNIFLNIYRLIEIYSNDFPHEGNNLKLEFDREFHDTKWRSTFPSIALEFSGENAIRYLIDYITLKGHLTCDLFENKIKMHLHQRSRIFGKEGKLIGFFVSDVKNLEECIEIYNKLNLMLGEDSSYRLFSELFLPFEGLSFSVENSLSILYLIRALNQKYHDEIEINELKDLIPKILMLFVNKPSLFFKFFQKNILEIFFSNNSNTLSENSDEKIFLINILSSLEYFHLFPLFYLFLKDKISVLEELLSEFKLNINKEFIDLITKEDNLIVPLKNKLIIESILKVLHKELPLNLIYSLIKKYSQLLEKEDLHLKDEFFWIQLIEQFLQVEHFKFIDAVEPFLYNKPFLFEFLSNINFEHLPFEKIVHILSIARELKEYNGVFKIITFYPQLFSTLDPLERMYLVNCKIEIKEIKNHFLNDFLFLIPIDNQILLQPNIQNNIQKLSPDSILKIILDFFEKKDLFSKICLRNFLQSKVISEKLRSRKKEIKSVLIGLKNKELFPDNLSAELMILFLGDLNPTLLTDNDIKFMLFCSKFLNLDDDYERNSFVFFIEIAHEKIIQLSKENKFKQEKIFEVIYEKTLDVCLNYIGVVFPKIWIKKIFKDFLNKNGCNFSILNIHRLIKDQEILEILENNISKLSEPLNSAQISILLNLFDGFISGLKTLLIHMEKFEILDQYCELNNKLFHTLKDESKFKFFKRTIEKKIVNHLIFEWIKLNDLSFFYYELVSPIFIEQCSEKDRIDLIQLIIKRNFNKEPFQDLIYTLFISLQDINKMIYYSFIDSVFNRLSSNNQIDLLIGLNFIEDSKKTNLIQKISSDFAAFEFLINILNKFPSVVFFNLQSKLKEEFDLVAKKVVYSVLKEEKEFKYDKLRYQFIEIYIDKFKCIFDENSIEIFEFIIANIEHFSLIISNFEEIIFQGFFKISPELLIKFLNFRLGSLEIIKSFQKRNYEKIFNFLINQLPIQDCFDFYIKNYVKLNFNEVLIQKLILKCLEQNKLKLIQNFIKIDKFKKIPNLADKKESKLFFFIEKLIVDTNTNQDLLEVFSDLKIIFPLIDSAEILANLFDCLFTKFLQNIVIIGNEINLFNEIFIYLCDFKSVFYSLKDTLNFNTLSMKAIEIMVNLSVNLNITEFFEILSLIFSKSKKLAKIYAEKIIKLEPTIYLKFFEEKDVHKFKDFIQFFSDFELIKKINSDLALKIDDILFEKLRILFEICSSSDEESEFIVLSYILDIYCSISKPKRTKFENKYIFESFDLFFNHKDLIFKKSYSNYFIVEQLKKMIDQQSPLIFVQDNADYINLIFFKFLESISVIAGSLKSIEISETIEDSLNRMKKEKKQIVSDISDFIFNLIENILIPLKDTNIQLLHYIFKMMTLVGDLNFNSFEIKECCIDNVIILVKTYLSKLNDDHHYEEKTDYFTSYKSSSKNYLKNIQNYTLSQIRNIVFSLLKKDMIKRYDLFLDIPELIEDLFKLNLFQLDESKIFCLENIYYNIRGFLFSFPDNAILFKQLWKVIFIKIVKKYFILMGKINSGSFDIKSSLNLNLLIQIIINASCAFQTSKSFFLNKHEEIFSEFSIQDLICVSDIMESYIKHLDGNFNRQFEFFKIIYSLLVTIDKRQSEFLDIDPKYLDSIYLVSSVYAKHFIKQVSTIDFIEKIKGKKFINNLVDSLYILIPEKYFSLVLNYYIEIAIREINSDKPSIAFLKRFFLFIVDKKLILPAVSFLESIKSIDNEEFLRTIPEFLNFEEFVNENIHEPAYSCSVF